MANGGCTGGYVETTHHGIDIVDLTVDQRIGIIVFGELSLRTTVQKVAATAYQQSGSGNKGGKKDIYPVSYNLIVIKRLIDSETWVWYLATPLEGQVDAEGGVTAVVVTPNVVALPPSSGV